MVTPVRTVDLAELVDIASKATQDELEWADDGEGLVLQGVHTGQIVLYAHDAPDDEVAVVVSDTDRALIAAASAPVVTALVARIGELHQALLHASGLLDPPEHDSDPSCRSFADEILALLAKVNQHEYVRKKLLATGTRQLVENSWRDDFWGWGPNRDGQNMLGKLWMEIRSDLLVQGCLLP